MRFLAALMLAFLAAAAHAQTVTTSPGPDAVSVSIYRNQNRSAGDELDLNDLQGYALITETRRISLPQGASTIRFEGVAEGIIPVSAIITGLPGGVIQKNRDARLLSPAALVDGSLGRMIHLKRTNRKTGKVTEQNAKLISGPEGGVIIRTAAGIEALGCAGLPEAIHYDGVPPGLTAKPTLSVDTQSQDAVTATVQLSYLANEFDWNADYVVRLHRDESKLDLFAWLTLANGNGESFQQAQTQAVAGTVNRQDDPDDVGRYARYGGQLSLQCWPMDITSTHPAWDGRIPPPGAVLEGGYGGYDSDGDIVVTAMRRSEMVQDVPLAVTAISATMIAKQEELGDLKLYRIPEPVTVAANAQKQVTLLQKQNVPFDLLYRTEDYQYFDQGDFSPQPAQRILRMQNKDDKGLGLPLPQGSVAVFEPARQQWMLIAENGEMRDTPVGEKVEIGLGEADQVQFELKRVRAVERKAKPVKPKKKQPTVDADADEEQEAESENFRGELGDYVLTVTNANPFPVKVEQPLKYYRGGKLSVSKGKLVTEIWPVWKATIPAKGSAELRYAFKQD